MNEAIDNTASIKHRKLKRRERLKTRAWELDALRGFAILGVLFDHFMFDAAFYFHNSFSASNNKFLINLADFALEYWNGDLRAYGQPFFVFIFFFVSGVCTIFSKNNIIRSLKISIVAALITLLTYLGGLVFDLEMLITFGVIHSLALTLIIFSIIDFILEVAFKNKSYKHWVKMSIYSALAFTILILDRVYNISLFALNFTYLPTHDNEIVGLFIYSSSWQARSADYFPLLPFLGFFMIGAAFAQLVYRKKQSLLPKLNSKFFSVLTFPGRHSLIIYLIAQVIFFVILGLISLIFLGHLGFG